MLFAFIQWAVSSECATVLATNEINPPFSQTVRAFQPTDQHKSILVAVATVHSTICHDSRNTIKRLSDRRAITKPLIQYSLYTKSIKFYHHRLSTSDNFCSVFIPFQNNIFNKSSFILITFKSHYSGLKFWNGSRSHHTISLQYTFEASLNYRIFFFASCCVLTHHQ